VCVCFFFFFFLYRSLIEDTDFRFVILLFWVLLINGEKSTLRDVHEEHPTDDE
jgi:hypothetical protein